MEQFSLPEGTQTLASSREQINNALLTTRSLSSDTKYPVDNVQTGMLCYRTDKNEIHQCTDGDSKTWSAKLNASISGNADTATVAASCSGNAASATSATQANAISITNTDTVSTGLILFTQRAGVSTALTSTKLYYNASTGALTATKLYNAVYNDYAEFFPRGEDTEAGDIVALDLESEEERYVKATTNSIVAGVHSDEYGHIIGGDAPKEGKDFIEYNLPRYIPVSLAGRVHVKVKGKVERGDYIVASDTAGVGVARKKPRYGRAVVGYALESSGDEDIKLIRVRVK